MSVEEWEFTPPAFSPSEGLQRLRRGLREMGLSERGGLWERKGVAVARLELQSEAILAAQVRRPVRGRPEWVARELKSDADTRDFTADLKRKLSQWSNEDE